MRLEFVGLAILGAVLIAIIAFGPLPMSAAPGSFDAPSSPENSHVHLNIVVPVRGALAGNAGDGNGTTYCFASDNTQTQLVRTNGQSIWISQAASVYGQSEGMTVYDDGIDVASPTYEGFAGPKTPVGMKLADARGWPNIAVDSGRVAIDPVRGRFKFHEGGDPELVGDWAGGNAHDGVFVQGDYAYVTDWTRGLDVVDISDPSNPVWKGNDPGAPAGGMMDVVVDGDTAYVTMKYDGLRIYDISDPSNPHEVGFASEDPLQLTLHLTKVGNLVYVAAEGDGVLIYNVSTPSSPIKKGVCPVYGHALTVVGDYAYIAAGGSGLAIYDISSPTSPSFQGSLATLGYTYDVQVLGQYAYVVEGSAGLRVVDVSNPSSPTHVASVATAGEAYDLRIANRCAYVAEKGTPGYLQVFDLSDPAWPVLLKTYESPSRISGLYPCGPLVYAAGHDQGLLVVNPHLSEAPYGQVTVDYNWDDDAETPTPTLVPTPTMTPDPSATMTLTVKVWLQGRGPAPSPSWKVPLHIELTVPNGGPTQHIYDMTCNWRGRATMTGVSQGVYDVWVHRNTSLVKVCRARSLAAGDHLIDMGSLFEGDANQDGRISILDFSILASSYGLSEGDSGYDARGDFNGDGRISVLDFSLLASNYGLEGPVEVTGG